MAKGYWIAHVTVSDPDQYKHYADAAPEAFAKYKARMLARGGQHAQMEGTGKARNVVIEFDSYQDASRLLQQRRIPGRPRQAHRRR